MKIRKQKAKAKRYAQEAKCSQTMDDSQNHRDGLSGRNPSVSNAFAPGENHSRMGAKMEMRKMK
jgi:hypothetical protein